MDVLKETNFPGLIKKFAGKVRDVYEKGDSVIIVTTDRHSSFDRLIAYIPWKGQVLNQISAFWFKNTSDVLQNHMIATPDPNVMEGKRCKTLPVEAVVRGYITGVTDTSLWTHYSKGQRDFGNFTLPNGMKKNQKLEKPVFTPSTKSDTHDRTLSPQQMVAEKIISQEMIDKVEKAALGLYNRGAEIAKKQGLILVDTKYEFGLDEKGELVLIDEIHTPDSSRFWQLDSYDERFAAGEEPQYFDKEFLRLWFKDNSDPYNDVTLPEAPKDLVEELSRRYIQMYEQITGEKFVPGETPVAERIERNLKPYAV